MAQFPLGFTYILEYILVGVEGSRQRVLRDLTLPPQVPPEVDEEGFTVRPDVSHNNILSVTVSPWGEPGPGPCPVLGG